MDITTALAASRLVAQQRAMDITANNIANANTPGYRTERVQFSDFVDKQTGTKPPPGVSDHQLYRRIGPPTGSLSPVRSPTPATRYDLAAHRRRLFHRQHQERPPSDPRWPVRPDAGRHTGRQPAATRCSTPPASRSRSPPTDTQIMIAGDGSISTESGSDRQDRHRRPQRSNEIASRGWDQFYFRRRHRASCLTMNRSGCGREIQRAAGDGSDADDERLREFQFVSQFIQAEGDREKRTIDKILPTGAGS